MYEINIYQVLPWLVGAASVSFPVDKSTGLSAASEETRGKLVSMVVESDSSDIQKNGVATSVPPVHTLPAAPLTFSLWDFCRGRNKILSLNTDLQKGPCNLFQKKLRTDGQ
jgi:hypothetical protein